MSKHTLNSLPIASGSALRDSKRPARIDRVPSLGRCIDLYLDVFGYTSDAIFFIHRAYLEAENSQDFTQRVSPALRITEPQAEWMYEFIDTN